MRGGRGRRDRPSPGTNTSTGTFRHVPLLIEDQFFKFHCRLPVPTDGESVRLAFVLFSTLAVRGR
jgi:hypothetical protein